MPGKHGIGTEAFTPIDGDKGFGGAADRLVEIHNEGRYVNLSDHDVQRVLDNFKASSLEELKIKRRGW